MKGVEPEHVSPLIHLFNSTELAAVYPTVVAMTVTSILSTLWA